MPADGTPTFVSSSVTVFRAVVRFFPTPSQLQNATVALRKLIAECTCRQKAETPISQRGSAGVFFSRARFVFCISLGTNLQVSFCEVDDNNTN